VSGRWAVFRDAVDELLGGVPEEDWLTTDAARYFAPWAQPEDDPTDQALASLSLERIP
jgi:hypothetical protein